MQMEPQPMPTLRASTPASIRFLAWAAVTTADEEEEEEEETTESGSVMVVPTGSTRKAEARLTISSHHLQLRILLLDVIDYVDLIH